MMGLAAAMFLFIGGMDEPYAPGAMAASTYPRLVLSGIILISCILFLRSGGAAYVAIPLRSVAAVALAAVYIMLIEPAGFFLTTPLFLIALPLLAGYRRPVPILAGAAAVTAALYGVFAWLLNIPLPAGLLGD